MSARPARHGGERAGRRLARAAFLALALAPAGPAWAQATLSGGRGTPLVPYADTVPPTHFTTSVGADWETAGGGRFQVAPVGVTLGVAGGLDLGIALRSWAPGEAGGRGATVDPRLVLKLRLLTESPRRPAVALSLAADHLFRGWDLSPSLILHQDRGRLLLAGELGWRRPSRAAPADPAGPFAGVAAGWWLGASTSLFLQVLGEERPDRRAWLMPGVAWSLLGPDPSEKRREALRTRARQAVADLAKELGTSIDTGTAAPASAVPPSAFGPAVGPREALLAVPGRVTLFATGGPALGASPGWRVVAGVQISSFDELLQDSDGDGIPDRVDQCPYQPEDWDGYQDEDGCPDDGLAVLRRRTLERLRAEEEKAGKPTTPFPAFRMRIPLGEIPRPGAGRREEAPAYRPLDRPPPGDAPAAPGEPGPVRPEKGAPAPSRRRPAPEKQGASAPARTAIPPRQRAGAAGARPPVQPPQAGATRARSLPRPAPACHIAEVERCVALSARWAGSWRGRAEARSAADADGNGAAWALPGQAPGRPAAGACRGIVACGNSLLPSDAGDLADLPVPPWVREPADR